MLQTTVHWSNHTLLDGKKEGDPKVNGLPSLLFKHLFSEVEPGVKKR